MKSTDVYKILRAELGQILKDAGFSREKPLLSWSKPASGLFTVIWCQVSRDGWDEFAGSKFTVEIQRSIASEPGTPSIFRGRIGKLLSPADLEAVWLAQNSIIATLKRPPSNYHLLHAVPSVADLYLSRFKAESAQYTNKSDIWFRYATPEHVRQWGRTIAGLSHSIIEAAEREA